MLGFTAAIAAYGAFIIPTIFTAGIKGGFLDVCFYIFALYYLGCASLNYWALLPRRRRVPMLTDTLRRICHCVLRHL
jgi:NNP family nitrate/nitrite transporter-like MFS transporter